MKLVCTIFLCLFFAVSVFAQPETVEKPSPVGVEEIFLARDDGKGAAGAPTTKFTTTELPVYVFIQLDSGEPATVKMSLIAVKAAGLKPETKVVTVSYATKKNENQVNFTASPQNVWAAGSYRVDVFLDGKLAKSQTFEIEKSAQEAVREKPGAPKTFAPRKPLKKPRKN